MFALVLFRGHVKSERQIMPSRRVIKGALHNFLGTFTSRNSDFDGYWVCGLLAREAGPLRFDLVGDGSGNPDTSSVIFAHRLAAQQFGEEIAKTGLRREWIREAYLDISKSASMRNSFAGDYLRACFEVQFHAHVVTDLGRGYGRVVSLLVAPHDPALEWRSTRRNP
jgi:hypothetical protein